MVVVVVLYATLNLRSSSIVLLFYLFDAIFESVIIQGNFGS